MHFILKMCNVESGERNNPLPVSAVIRPSRKGVIVTIAREHGFYGKRIG